MSLPGRANYLDPSQQAARWAYRMQANGRALAQYPGDVDVDGLLFTVEDIESHGVAGDARQGTATCTSGNKTIPTVGLNPTAADIGKAFYLQYAGNGIAPLLTVIEGVSGANVIVRTAPGANIATPRIAYIGTDDTAAIDAYVASMPSNRITRFNSPLYLYSNPTGLVIGNGSALGPSSLQGCSFIGNTPTTVNIQTASIRIGTRIAYVGTTPATWLCDVRGPQLFNLKNLCFDGNYYAEGGCNFKHVIGSEWDGFGFINPIGKPGGGTPFEFFKMGAYPDAATFGTYSGCSDNALTNGVISTTGALAMRALVVGESVYPVGGGLDVSLNTFQNLAFLIATDPNAVNPFVNTPTTSFALTRQFCDNNVFIRCFTYVDGVPPTGRRGRGVVIKPPSGPSPAGAFPLSDTFIACPNVGGVTLDESDNTYVPDLASGQGMPCFPLNLGDASDPSYTGGAVGYPTSPNKPIITGFADNGVQLNAWQPVLTRSGVVLPGATVPRRNAAFAQTPVNSAVETDIFSTVVPAYMMQAFNFALNANAYLNDRILEAFAYGALYNNSGGPLNFVFRAYMGATKIFDTQNIAIPNDGGVGALQTWQFQMFYAMRNSLTSADVTSSFTMGAAQGGGALATQDTQLPWRKQMSGVAVDMSLDQTFRITAQISAANPNAYVNTFKRFLRLY